MKSSKPVLGLIGGIGSGKSRVAEELVKRGGYLISGDQLGHEALRQPDIRDRVRQRFGPQVVKDNGDVDRRLLGTMVFSNAAERRALEEMVFPFIERRIAEEIAAAQEVPQIRLIVVDAAVLLEAGWDRFCDHIVFVEAPPAVRLQRVAQQRGWNEKEVALREQAQWLLTAKRAKANHVVDNAGSLAQLQPQLDALLQQLSAAGNQPATTA